LSYNDEPIKNVENIGFEALKNIEKIVQHRVRGCELGM
jgi:hypothetical protein